MINGARSRARARIERVQGRVVVNVRLREGTKADRALIERWLRADHVRGAWGDPDENLRLLGAPPADACWRTFARAGLRVDREFDDVPNGRHVLMVRPRPRGEAS